MARFEKTRFTTAALLIVSGIAFFASGFFTGYRMAKAQYSENIDQVLNPQRNRIAVDSLSIKLD